MYMPLSCLENANVLLAVEHYSWFRTASRPNETRRRTLSRSRVLIAHIIKWNTFGGHVKTPHMVLMVGLTARQRERQCNICIQPLWTLKCIAGDCIIISLVPSPELLVVLSNYTPTYSLPFHTSLIWLWDGRFHDTSFSEDLRSFHHIPTVSSLTWLYPNSKPC